MFRKEKIGQAACPRGSWQPCHARVCVPANDQPTVVPRLSSLSDTHEASVNDAMETQYNYMRYIGRKCSRAFKTCAMCAIGRAPLSAQVMPSISKRRKGKKKKKGPMQRPTEQRSGIPLRQTMLARWVDICGFGFVLAEVKSVMAVRTATFVCA